jgi:peptidoglycan/LPS O-acetylase OafA/YrhL
VVEAGGLAVMIFIILSGFVITHLIVTQEEPYRVYIARRALRIYPIYLLALLLGIGTTFLTFKTFLGADGSPDPAALAIIDYPQINNLLLDRVQVHGPAYFLHLLSHLSMLHGVFASTFLRNSEFMFLAPAWSLSLEWQFYLVAPLVIWSATRKLPSLVLVGATLSLFFLYSRNLFGWWALPSFLPGASIYFAAGIASRLLVTRKQFRFSWWAGAILAVGFVVLDGWQLPVEVWIVFLAASLWQVRGGRFSGPSGRVFRLLFESRPATHLGEASYSTYLLHFPILQLAMYIAVRGLTLTPMAATTFVAVTTLLSTYVLSQLTHRFVERPFMALGKRIGGEGSSGQTALANTA